MARENVANALQAVSQGLMQFSTARAEREFREMEAMREEALIRLRGEIDRENIELDRGYRQDEARTEREFRTQLSRDERAADDARAQADREHREKLASEETARYGERFRRDDIQSLQTMHQQTMRRLDDRIRDVMDQLREGDLFPGTPGYEDALRELDELQLTKNQSDLAFAQRMRDLKAAGYEGLTDEQIVRNLGYSDDEIAQMVRSQKDDPDPLAAPTLEEPGNERPRTQPGADLDLDTPDMSQAGPDGLAPVEEGFDLIGPVPQAPSYSRFGRKPRARRLGLTRPELNDLRSPRDSLEPIDTLPVGSRQKPMPGQMSPDMEYGRIIEEGLPALMNFIREGLNPPPRRNYPSDDLIPE